MEINNQPLNFKESEIKLEAEIKSALPDFYKMVSCYHNATSKPECVILHQDSFAADYQDEEFTLLGKAIKFAGIYGLRVQMFGKNRETL